MASLNSTLKSRALSQANTNTETNTGRVTKTYPDENGNIAAADILIQGQSYLFHRVRNASGISLWAGMSIKLNWPRGSRFKPEIIGAAGAEAGTALSAAQTGTNSAIFDGSSGTANLSGIPVLLSDSDTEGAPDGSVLQPGANAFFEVTDPSETSGGAINGALQIHVRPLVMTSLPDATTTELLDGTLADLVTSYGEPLGMYRLDKEAGEWKRRDVGEGGTDATDTTKGILKLAGDLAGTADLPLVAGLQGRAVAGTAPTDGQVLAWDDPSSSWKPYTLGAIDTSLRAFSKDFGGDNVWWGQAGNQEWNGSSFNDAWGHEIQRCRLLATALNDILICEFYSDQAGTFRAYVDYLANNNLSDIQACDVTGSTLYGNNIPGYAAIGAPVLDFDTGWDVALSRGWNKLYFKVTTSETYVVVKRLWFVPV